MPISTTPWGQFSQADYTPEQWRRACLVDTGQGDVDSKERYKLPVREPDGTLNRNGVHAAAGGHGLGAVRGITPEQRRAAARKLVALYHEMDEEPPESMTMMAARSREPREYFDRSYPLEGIEILSRAKGGDGRTVEAYAAVFDVEQEIHDQHGDYREKNDRTAFNMTINSGAAMRALPLYHHGRSVVDPSRLDSLAQVPLGHPKEIRADGHGLLTVTRYNKSALADSVLEAIKNDDIRAQSYRGRIYKSNPRRVPRVRTGEPLPLVTRMELGLSDYGPTPRPYYEDARIVAVRAAQDIFSGIAGLDEAERAELIRMLATTRPFEPEPETATSTREAGAEEPRKPHSGRFKDLARQRELANWAELAYMEMATHGKASE